MNTRSSAKDIRCAIRKNEVHTVRSILTKNPEIINPGHIDLFEGMQVSPFWEALLSGHHEIVDLFLDFKARPDEPFPVCDSAFHGFTFLQCVNFFAVDSESSLRVAEVLISRGADVNAYNQLLSQTVLQTALLRGNVKYAEFLLNHGARLKGPEWHTRGPVNYVLASPKTEQAELLQVLINHGLDLTVRNEAGYDYIQFIISKAANKPERVDYLKIVKILIDCGVPVDRSNHHGMSSLYMAMNLQSPKLVSMLVKKGADVNFRYVEAGGFFPLYVAACKSNLKLVELLLTSGADVNAKLYDGHTALHQACHQRNEGIISLLLRKGACVKGDPTPFSYLKPEIYQESDISCINVMVKELAKRRFISEDSVSEKDMDLVKGNPVVQQLFQNRTRELERMSKIKFYASHSYLSVMSSVKRLAKLAKNPEFVQRFKQRLNEFPYYKKDLRKILEEAVKVRDKLVVVEQRLRCAFGDFLPDVVRRKLAESLAVDDLPLEDIVID